MEIPSMKFILQTKLQTSKLTAKRVKNLPLSRNICAIKRHFTTFAPLKTKKKTHRCLTSASRIKLFILKLLTYKTKKKVKHQKWTQTIEALLFPLFLYKRGILLMREGIANRIVSEQVLLKKWIFPVFSSKHPMR